MTVYVIVQLKMTDRAAYDRYQARFFDVFKKFSGRLLSAAASPRLGGLTGISGNLEGPHSRRTSHRAAGEGIRALDLYHDGPNPKPRKNGTGV